MFLLFPSLGLCAIRNINKAHGLRNYYAIVRIYGYMNTSTITIIIIIVISSNRKFTKHNPTYIFRLDYFESFVSAIFFCPFASKRHIVALRNIRTAHRAPLSYIQPCTKFVIHFAEGRVLYIFGRIILFLSVAVCLCTIAICICVCKCVLLLNILK